MLQQTQVERVIPFYTKFLRKFSSAKRLSQAPLGEVLKAWQGLGYNRRAKMLQGAAQELATREITTIEELEGLPGVGPYTARAVAAFAWNKNTVFIETNIRTVVIHHFFPKKKKVSDTQIIKKLDEALPKGRAQEWYSALMDYGSYLKRSGISHNLRSKTYTKQSKFTGSLREARGAILRRLSEGTALSTDLVELLGSSRRAQMRTALQALWSEKFIVKNGGMYRLAD
jgi:A/G-specific adenine glycosylase